MDQIHIFVCFPWNLLCVGIECFSHLAYLIATENLLFWLWLMIRERNHKHNEVYMYIGVKKSTQNTEHHT